LQKDHKKLCPAKRRNEAFVLNGKAHYNQPAGSRNVEEPTHRHCREWAQWHCFLMSKKNVFTQSKVMNTNKQGSGKTKNTGGGSSANNNRKRTHSPGTHTEQDQPDHPMYEGKTKSSTKENEKAAQKNDEKSGPGTDSTKKTGEGLAPEFEEQGSKKNIVNEQDQTRIVNQESEEYGGNGGSDEDRSEKNALNRDDFPEADDSGEQPIKKVPTMDA
jgi:hypothetical protein